MAMSENLDDAIDMSQQIEKLTIARRELKAGLFVTELGVAAAEKALKEHPLAIEISAKILELRVAIAELV